MQVIKEIIFHDWILEVDVEANQNLYKSQPYIGKNSHCTCIYCQNFSLVADTFPSELKQFFKRLGIDYKKEAHVEYFDREEKNSSNHIYIVGYHFVGNIRKKPVEQAYPVTANYDVHISTRLDLLPDEFPANSLELVIEGSFPWLLDEEPEELVEKENYLGSWIKKVTEKQIYKYLRSAWIKFNGSK